jgi:glycerophosphoryl diester phosphodiesterase
MANLFAHRGFWQEKNFQNTIASLDAAYAQKFFGVEFDIWLIDGELVLKHDEPRAGEVLPFFHDYLKFGNEFHYWLDFKNLNEANLDEVFELVKIALEEKKLDLNKFYFAPFITDYDLARKVLQKAREVFGKKIHFTAVCDRHVNLEKMQHFIEKNSVKHLSIFHQFLDKNLLENLGDIEIFAWTVNDKNRLFELEALGVKNFATDQITPQIYGETKT